MEKILRYKLTSPGGKINFRPATLPVCAPPVKLFFIEAPILKKPPGL